MAPPRSKEQIQADMDALLQKQQSGEIDLAKYSQDLGSLMQEMNLIIYKETTPPEPDYFEGQKFKELEVKDTLKDVAKGYGVEAEKEVGESLPIEEAFARGKARVEKEILPLRYKTGERVDYMEGLGISDVVDPIKGLIRDPQTGKVRKGTKFELLKEIPFRQRLMTKTQEQRVQERYEKSQREKGVLDSLSDLMVEEIVSEPIAENSFFGNIYPDEMVTVVESPLATGLRAGLNTGSAVMAPMVRSINNMIGYFTEAPVSTRKRAGYEKTEIEGMGAQALTNALLGQGVGTQLAAQSFPPDEKYDGLFNIATQGSWGNLLALGAAEIGVPITPFGEILNIPGKSLANLSKVARQNARILSKTAKGQRRIMAITNPVEAVRYSGIRSEIDEALKAVEQGKTVADLEKEIVKKGGVLKDNTLRAKNAEFVGDVYAAEKTAQEIIKNAKRTGKTEIKVEDVPEESPTLRAMFTEEKPLPLKMFETKTNRLTNVLSKTTGTGKKGVAILRNMKNTADEVSNAILTGKAPVKNKSLINRAINVSKIMNYNMWALASNIVSKPLLPTVKEAQRLLLKSSIKPLTPEEIIKIGDAWKDLDNAKVWDKVDQSLFKKPQHIYQSTRNAVAEVAKDTMLRNFTDDLIYQSSTVAVPVKNLKTSTGRNTPAFDDYKFEMNQMLTSTIDKSLSHTLTDSSVKKLLQYERSSGLTISPTVKEKIQAGTPITKEEYNLLVDQVSGELAIDFLGGVRLQQGTLTAQRAQSLLESRQELIPAGRTVSTFKLGYKELANALRFTLKDTRVGDWFGVGTRLDQEVPVMFQRFNQAMQDANSSAMSQVTERLTRGVRDKTVDPTINFDENLAYYTQVSQDLEIKTMGMSPRQDVSLEISPTERLEFVGDVDYKKLYAQKLKDYASSREEKLEDLVNLRMAKDLDKFEANVQKSFNELEKTFSKDLDSINKQYVRDLFSAKARKEDFESRLNVQYANAYEKFEANVQKSFDELEKTFSKELDSINQQYGRDILQNRARKEDLKSRLDVQYANAYEKFEASSDNARQVMQRKYDRQVEKLNKYFNRRYMELTLKQRNVVSDFKTKATQITKRFKFAKQRKDLQKTYENYWDLIYNTRLREEKWLENKIAKKRNEFFDKLINDSPEAIKNTNTKILDAIKQTEEIERKFDDAIRTHKIEYRESKKLLDETIDVERDRFFNELANNVSDSLERTETKILSEISRIEEIEKGLDVSAKEQQNMLIQSKKLLDEIINAERDALFKEFENYATSEKFDKFNETTQKTLKNIQERIDIRVQKNQEQAIARSEKVAAQRQTQILADKYGRDNVNDYLKSQGIEPTYENIVESIDDITQNIEVASRQMHQMKIWEDVIDDFFQAPSGSKEIAKVSLRDRWQDNLRSLVRRDSGKPFWTEGNIIPLTLDNYRKMIAVLREKDGSLKKYGLAEVKLLPGRKELYTLPLVKKMVEIQRTSNMNDTINQFIEQSPEMFLQLQRRHQTTLGLTATKQIADELVVNIQNTTTRAIEKGLLSEDVLSAVIPRIREVLFDGMMADIWKNSSREVQKIFFDKYLRTLTETGKPIITDMNEFVLQMYNTNVLKSDTFQKVERQVQRILNDTQKIIKGIREGKPQDFKYNIKQGSKETSITVDAGSAPAPVGRELTKTEARIFQDLEKALPSVVDSMRNEYLNAITLRGGGVMDGLFSQQMNDLNAMMSSYGLSADTLVDNINRISPRFEYIGKQNVALIFGDMHADSMQKIIEISKSGKAQSILTELQKRAANLNAPSGSTQFWGAYMAEMFSVLRRGAIAQMLGGFILPAFRFFGMNSFSSPIIFATNLGAGEMKASTITKFSGLATVAPFITFPKTQVLGSRMKSNRYLRAPDEEIIISQAEGALKDYTAKELREIDAYYGVQNSMYDAELQSSQFNRLLIDIKATASGYKRTGLLKDVVDNLSPSGKNIWAEWSQAQDAQMRRFVFVDALKNGDSVPQAVEKARRSINDYGSLTPFERRYVAKSIWFYSFMRTMGTGVINSVYRAVLSGKTSPALKFLQIQDRLNRETLQDYESSTNAIKGRVFNIFTGTMDGVNMYAGGMMNPQMQMFDLMSNASIYMLFAADKLTGQERRLEASLFNASMSFLAQMGKTGLQQSPLVGLGIESLEAEYGRGIPFPSELIYRAEAEGNLPELIKAYGLVERTPTPGRPLTRDGKYYDFPKDEAGIAMRRRYLMHRLLGLTSLNIVSDVGGFWQGAQSRGLKEFYRASMFAESDPTITTPRGEEIPLETRTKYLKSLNKQQLEGYGNLWFSLYLSGLLTPLKDQPIKKNIDYGLRALENDLKKKRK